MAQESHRALEGEVVAAIGEHESESAEARNDLWKGDGRGSGGAAAGTPIGSEEVSAVERGKGGVGRETVRECACTRALVGRKVCHRVEGSGRGTGKESALSLVVSGSGAVDGRGDRRPWVDRLF